MLLGIQKTSLVDYPGRVSAVLFTAGCGLRCPYCHNPDLVSPSGAEGPLASIDEALAFLETRKAVLSGVVISGGEPTMHDGLPELASAIRGLGLAVKLDTNGTRPDRIAPVAADYVAMDLKTAPRRYPELWPGAPPDAAEIIARGVAAVRASGADYEFRITCAPGVFAEADARAVAELLEPGDAVFLQRYRPGRVLDAAWAAGVSPYTEARLEGLLAIVREAAPRARLRGH
ncbi:MAG: anaerobic ribonucleoside-triphosphate reductase activating protein [Spirochaetes bacterium]|nr:anaerobic ribonucleoside-triphosphate reductase activating protein [Spirochaetota bacterium]MBU1081671.1 anaerobic ribonucleoside-triphosphate reductase activating protein [Spirochaetota bacterium]